MAIFTLPKVGEFAANLLARGSDVLANDQYLETTLNGPNLDQANLDPAMTPIWTGIWTYANAVIIHGGSDLTLYSDTANTAKTGAWDSATGNIGMALGAKFFIDDPGLSGVNYMYRSAANQIGFATGSIDRLTIDATSGVYIRQGNEFRLDAAGNTNPKDFRMRVTSSGANFDELHILGETGVSSEVFQDVAILNANGDIYFPLHATTGSAANAYLDAGTGRLQRSTSSIKYKDNVTDLEVDSAQVHNLRPVSYDDKATGDRFFGLIAEEVDQILPELVQHNSVSNECEYVTYDRLAVLLLAEVKKLRTELDELKASLGN